ncbi:hypothetical protein GWK47_007303 [Chionoecetes opilio]|uniref:Uncharacterized protein n=1 Tax=Chionoecetes opilio TaxID=41210 RepID=A0A8J4Y1E3_CHIOP|nr:hypothetical protein GWK47_007303 [Chionoecetes opilio]
MARELWFLQPPPRRTLLGCTKSPRVAAMKRRGTQTVFGQVSRHFQPVQAFEPCQILQPATTETPAVRRPPSMPFWSVPQTFFSVAGEIVPGHRGQTLLWPVASPRADTTATHTYGLRRYFRELVSPSESGLGGPQFTNRLPEIHEHGVSGIPFRPLPPV